MTATILDRRASFGLHAAAAICDLGRQIYVARMRLANQIPHWVELSVEERRNYVAHAEMVLTRIEDEIRRG